MSFLLRDVKALLLPAALFAVFSLPAASVCEESGRGDTTAAPAAGKDSAAPPVKSEDELLPFQDMPVVISASRKEEKIGLTSVPVSVVTKEDIHYSGISTLPEVFDFVPGVDVIPYDRNRYAVGVRGLHEYYSERTLTLIDGRSAESARFGGPEFMRYPVFMEDIERIEVVRGPAGAAWGANAFNGVVNILTKKPEDTQGVLATTTVNEFGDTSSQVRWGAKKDRWAWRTSFGYREFESSEDAVADDDFDSRDFGRAGIFDGEAAYKLSPDTRVSFGVGYLYSDLGPFEDGTLEPTECDRWSTLRTFARVDHRFEDGKSGYLQWYGNFTDDYEPRLMKSRTSQNDLEGQFSFTVAQDHHFTVGGNVRWTHINVGRENFTDFYLAGEPFDEYQGGAFAMDRWQVNRRLVFEAQARGDWYSQTQVDWSTRLSVLYALDDRQRHVVRFSGARAFRAPQTGLRRNAGTRSGGPFTIVFEPAGDDLHNEGIASFEAGYSGHLAKRITLRLDGYYQSFNDLIGLDRERSVRFVPFLPFPLTRSTLTARHIDGAHAYGGEAELVVSGRIGRLSAWYAYNEFIPDRDPQNLRAYLPAKNKAGLNGRLYLPHRVTLNGAYRYSDMTRSPDPERYDHVQCYHRLDFAVSKKFAGERAELLLGVRDVLDDTAFPIVPTGALVGHETPGRTFFGRLQLKF